MDGVLGHWVLGYWILGRLQAELGALVSSEIWVLFLAVTTESIMVVNRREDEIKLYLARTKTKTLTKHVAD